MRPAISVLRLKLAAWYMASFLILLGVSALAIYLSVKGSWERSLLREQDQDFSTIQAMVYMSPQGAGPNGHLEGDVMFKVTENGRLVYHSAAICGTEFCTARSEPEDLREGGVWRSREGREYMVKRTPLNAAGHEYLATVVIDLSPMRTHLASLAAILLATLSGGLILAAAGGYVMAARALAPLGRMAEKAAGISAANLSERLPVENANDELGRMAAAFNRTLERLEGSFRQLNEFTANASHELRTPLAAIRNVGEVALSSDRDAPRYREAIGTMLEETNRLTRLVQSLLTLARAEAGRLALAPASADLAALARSVVELLGVLAEEKGQSIEMKLSPPLPCRCDVAMMKQVLINVLDNAIRFTPGGGIISVTAGVSGANEAVVDIIDQAPHIPPEDREAVFTRYHGVAGTAGGNGNGLGLAISKWIVELNGGVIRFDDAPAGNRCRIMLPSIPPVRRPFAGGRT